MGSSFVLNKCRKEKMWTIYPWIDQCNNVKNTKDQLRSVQIPNISPNNLVLNTGRYDLLSMVAGDFLEVYANDPMHHGAWDAIVSCFFLDTGSLLCSLPTSPPLRLPTSWPSHQFSSAS